MNQLRGYRTGLIFKSITIVTTLALTACSVRKFPEYSQPPAAIANHQVRNNIEVTCDCFIEKDRLEKYFGVDLLNKYAAAEPAYAILPVYVYVENMGSDTVLLQNGSIRFTSSNGDVIAFAVDGNAASMPGAQAISNRNKTLNTVSIVGVLLLPLLIGVVVAAPFVVSANATDQSAADSMTSKYIHYRSLAGGQRNSGFIYFLIKAEQFVAIERVDTLQMNVKNLETNEEVPFSFRMNLHELTKRLAKPGDTGQHSM